VGQASWFFIILKYNMQKYTKLLFFVSILLALSSMVLIERGGYEIYPFFSWKLFTNPSGNSKVTEQYRMYRIQKNDTMRLSHRATPLYDENELAKITDFYGAKIEHGDHAEANKAKFRLFLQSTGLSGDGLVLYRESFDTRLLGRPSYQIRKTRVTSYDGL